MVIVQTSDAKWLHKRLPSDVKLTCCIISNPVDANLTDPSAIKTGAVAPVHSDIAVNKIVVEQIGVDLPDSLSHRAALVYQSEK